MPRVSEAVIGSELDRLMELLRQDTGALNLARRSEASRGAHGTVLPRRTLRRRLERLVVEGIVRPDGEDRRTRYHLGSAAGYGLRPSEFVAWRDRARAQRVST